MKKMLLLLLSVAVCLSVFGCSDSAEEKEPYSVGVDTPPSSEISGEDVSVVVGEGEAVIYHPDELFNALEKTVLPFNGDGVALVALMVEKWEEYLGQDSGIKANSVTVKGDTVYVDMNTKYGEYVSAGTTAEYFGVGGLVNTLISNYAKDGVTKVMFTVNDEYLSTGHYGVFDTPLTFFE